MEDVLFSFLGKNLSFIPIQDMTHYQNTVSYISMKNEEGWLFYPSFLMPVNNSERIFLRFFNINTGVMSGTLIDLSNDSIIKEDIPLGLNLSRIGQDESTESLVLYDSGQKELYYLSYSTGVLSSSFSLQTEAGVSNLFKIRKYNSIFTIVELLGTDTGSEEISPIDGRYFKVVVYDSVTRSIEDSKIIYAPETDRDTGYWGEPICRILAQSVLTTKAYSKVKFSFRYYGSSPFSTLSQIDREVTYIYGIKNKSKFFVGNSSENDNLPVYNQTTSSTSKLGNVEVNLAYPSIFPVGTVVRVNVSSTDYVRGKVTLSSGNLLNIEVSQSAGLNPVPAGAAVYQSNTRPNGASFGILTLGEVVLEEPFYVEPDPVEIERRPPIRKDIVYSETADAVILLPAFDQTMPYDLNIDQGVYSKVDDEIYYPPFSAEVFNKLKAEGYFFTDPLRNGDRVYVYTISDFMTNDRYDRNGVYISPARCQKRQISEVKNIDIIYSNGSTGILPFSSYIRSQPLIFDKGEDPIVFLRYSVSANTGFIQHPSYELFDDFTRDYGFINISYSQKKDLLPELTHDTGVRDRGVQQKNRILFPFKKEDNKYYCYTLNTETSLLEDTGVSINFAFSLYFPINNYIDNNSYHTKDNTHILLLNPDIAEEIKPSPTYLLSIKSDFSDFRVLGVDTSKIGEAPDDFDLSASSNL